MEEIENRGFSTPAGALEIVNTESNATNAFLDDTDTRTFFNAKTELAETNVDKTSMVSGVEISKNFNDSSVTDFRFISFSSKNEPNNFTEIRRISNPTTRLFCNLLTLPEKNGFPKNDETFRFEFPLQEIDRPASSMSSDVAETSLSIGESQSGCSNFNASGCGPLVPYHSKLTDDRFVHRRKNLFAFRVPWQPYGRNGHCVGNKTRANRLALYESLSTSITRARALKMPHWLNPKLPDERRLRLAAACNNTDQVKTLLENGVDPNCSDEQLRTPLHLASGRGYTEIVRLLLHHGAIPSSKDVIGNTPLHLAAVTSKISVVTLLLSAGADPLSSDRRGFNPLQLAETKLRLLQNCKAADMVKIKTENRQVVAMLVTYLKKRDGSEDKIAALSTFCSRLTLSNSSNEVQDEVRELLGNIDALSLKS